MATLGRKTYIMENKEIIKIGLKELAAYVERDAVDAYKFSIETSGNKREKYAQTFYPISLGEETGESFPNDTELSIYNVESDFRVINTIWIKKKNGVCKISLNINVCYSNWGLHESLGYFIDRYKAALTKTKLFEEVTSSKEEYGYYLECVSTVENDASIYRSYSKIESSLESTYRNTLILTQEKSVSSFSEGRLHWWVRYVAVPLVGSGTIAAVIAKYLLA